METEKLQKEIVQVIQNFFQEERGNRITSFNMTGLVNVIGDVFSRHMSHEEAVDEKLKCEQAIDEKPKLQIKKV